MGSQLEGMARDSWEDMTEATCWAGILTVLGSSVLHTMSAWNCEVIEVTDWSMPPVFATELLILL